MCALLRANDPLTREVPAFYDGCPVLLGQALTENTHVTSLELNTWMHDGSASGGASGYRRPEALLTFLANSQTLTEVTLTEEDDGVRPVNDKAFCDDILAALAQKTSTITVDWCRHFSPESISRFLLCTESLSNFKMDIDLFANDPDRLMVAQALGANKTLCCLLIRGLTDASFADAILSHLPTHSTLKELILNPRGENLPVYALCAYLRSCSIQHIALRDLDFGKETWELLSDALRSNPVIEKLTLKWCSFDSEGTQAFIKSMLPVSDGSVVVRELSLTKSPMEATFGDAIFGKVVADLLTDSPLETLHLLDLSSGMMSEDDDFFRILEEKEARIRIPCLHVDYLKESEAEAFSYVVRLSTHLRSFTVQAIDSEFYQYSIVQAMHENGSIQTMSLAERQGYRTRDGPPLSISERRELELLLERNRTLPQLLRHPRLADTDDDAFDATDLALFPVLFSAARVAVFMAPSWLLAGLLAASGTAIGPKMGNDA
jgi:hypothetical protein